MVIIDYERVFKTLISRYKGATPESIIKVLCPMLIPISTLDRTIMKLDGQNHYRASFTVPYNESTSEILIRGRTGKFVSKEYVEGNGVWSEIAKGRIIEIDLNRNLALGEIYTGSTKDALVLALDKLKDDDYLEIDQYGASAKVLSGLVEYSLSKMVIEKGYAVKRMPEDMARHLGAYYHYDFEFEKNGVSKKIEVKSLWGTNTKYARLIHSKTHGYLTSSCKFATQDIFAVSLFLRTGDIRDFAFARSVPNDEKSYGLPRASNFNDYVHQNPICEVGNGVWYSDIDDVWDLD